jgi:transposase
MTFLAALRHDRIDAPWVVDGPINGELFRLYVAKVLIPTLEQGDIVVLDNLGSHKGRAVRNAIKAAGAHLIFLPPYSPDLNPIEQVFAKLKHMMRKAGERTFENTWRRAGALLDLFITSRVSELSIQSRLRFRLKTSCSSGVPARQRVVSNASDEAAIRGKNLNDELAGSARGGGDHVDQIVLRITGFDKRDIFRGGVRRLKFTVLHGGGFPGEFWRIVAPHPRHDVCKSLREH